MARVIPAIQVDRAVLTTTLGRLRSRGSVEAVMLWLGRRDAHCSVVVEAYDPIFTSREDQFIIPPEGVSALMARIAETRLAVVAQIHTHPGIAYHSEADERWAIVRHAGAYSVVLPWFATRTTVDNFWADAAVFVMQADAQWQELSSEEVREACQLP